MHPGEFGLLALIPLLAGIVLAAIYRKEKVDLIAGAVLILFALWFGFIGYATCLTEGIGGDLCFA